MPGIPSAADMARDGVSLKELNLKLLEKIEELTLYTLEQESQLREKDSRISSLESRMSVLEDFLKASKK